MPVYMNSGKIVAGRVDGDSKVLQEVLADLKIPSEMEVAPRYIVLTLFTRFILFKLLYTA